MIQSPKDEGFESSLHSLHTGNQELKKCEGFRNYLAKSCDGDDLILGNSFHCLLFVLVITSSSSLSFGLKNG